MSAARSRPLLFGCLVLVSCLSARIANAQEVFLEGHEGAVTMARFFANDAFAITTSADRTVRLWDTSTGNEIQRFSDHTAPVYALDVSPDGRFAASGAQDNTVRLWDLPASQPIESISQPLAEGAKSLISRDGRSFFVANGKSIHEVPFRQPQSGTGVAADLLTTYEPSNGHAVSLCESRDGTVLALGKNDGRVAIWSPFLKKTLVDFQAHDAQIRNVGFGATSATLVSVDETGVVRIWQIAEAIAGKKTLDDDGQEVVAVPVIIREYQVAGGSCIAAELLSNGSQLATVSKSGALELSDINSGNILRTIAIDSTEIRSLSTRPDGQRVAVATNDGVPVWNLADGVLVVKLDFPGARLVGWSSDGKQLLATNDLGQLNTYGPSLPGQPSAELVVYYEQQISESSVFAEFSRDGRNVWVGTRSHILSRWPNVSPIQLRQLSHSGAVYGIAITPDSDTVVTCGADQTVRVWDAMTGQQKFQMRGHQGAVHAVAVNNAGTQAVSTGADGTIRLWDIVGGRQLKQLASFSATMYSVLVVADGTHAIVGGADSVIRVIDLKSGDVTESLKGHRDYIHCLRLYPGGQRFLSYGYSGRFHSWEYPSGKQTTEAQIGRIGNYADISANQQRLIVASGDGTAHILPIPK